MPKQTVPSDLYVDVDGTLLRTDLLLEAAWRYCKFAPWRVTLLLRLAFKGPAVLKSFLARYVRIDVACLPYEPGLLDHLRQRKAQGGQIYLITASHWTYARAIAKHLGLFDGAYGSSNRLNLKGPAKLAAIRRLSAGNRFAYAGDSAADRPIWAEANKAILVNAPRKDVEAAQKAGQAELVIHSRPSRLRAWWREMRLHQWAKNALVFLPLLTSHNYGDPQKVWLTLVAFLAFGLCASGHYFLNDLLDLDADRVHVRKRLRPLASGDLPILHGVAGAILLPLVSFALSLALLPWLFTLSLAAYFVLTNLYSFYFKRISTADVFVLASLYTTRVVAGAAAISVVVSSWLLAFSMFLFLSLAYLKRYIEMQALAGSPAKASGRGYSGADVDTMFMLGIGNSTAAVLVLALYISSPEVTGFYHRPGFLWGLCLLILYWSNRVWVGARRGKIHDDPVVFALKDRVSLLVGGACVLVVLAARLIP